MQSWFRTCLPQAAMSSGHIERPVLVTGSGRLKMSSWTVFAVSGLKPLWDLEGIGTTQTQL